MLVVSRDSASTRFSNRAATSATASATRRSKVVSNARSSIACLSSSVARCFTAMTRETGIAHNAHGLAPRPRPPSAPVVADMLRRGHPRPRSPPAPRDGAPPLARRSHTVTAHAPPSTSIAPGQKGQTPPAHAVADDVPHRLHPQPPSAAVRRESSAILPGRPHTVTGHRTGLAGTLNPGQPPLEKGIVFMT